LELAWLGDCFGCHFFFFLFLGNIYGIKSKELYEK